MRLAVVGVIVVITIAAFCFYGCGHTSSAVQSEDLAQREAIVKLPDGTYVYGVCDKFTRWGGGWMSITIDGFTYNTSEYNICIIENNEGD